MAYQNIIVETRGHVGLVTLNRPQALNALNEALIAELNEALGAFEADPAIGCTVITGSEKAFAAGADVKEMAEKTYVDAYLGTLPRRLDEDFGNPQAGDRGGLGLLPRRRAANWR